MQITKKSESKLLDRLYVEVSLEGKAGKISRKEVVTAVAQELGVPSENVGLVRMEGQSGTTGVVGKFYVYGSQTSKNRLHHRYLDERTLTKEQREKLKQERKKAAAPQAAPEAKK